MRSPSTQARIKDLAKDKPVSAADYLDVLPASPAALVSTHPHLAQAWYTEHSPISCPVAMEMHNTIMARIKCRGATLAVARAMMPQPMTQSGGFNLPHAFIQGLHVT